VIFAEYNQRDFAKFLFWMCDECGRDFAPEKDQEAVDPSDLDVEW